MTTTVTISAQAMTMRPSFQKSPNRYPPGPYTIRLTPLAKGVRKDALAPMATPNIIGSAETPNSEAVAKPIGIMTSADDVLEINWVTTADTIKSPASTASGPAAESRGNEKNATRRKIWRKRKFSMASLACSPHTSARTVATGNATNYTVNYLHSSQNVKLEQNVKLSFY